MALQGTQSQHSRVRIGDTCWAGVTLSTSGKEWAVANTGNAEGTDIGDWLERGSNSDYWARCNVITGSLSVSSSTGVWHALSGQEIWRISQVGLGQNTAEIDVLLAAGSGGTPLLVAATRYDLSATEDV